MISSTDCDVTGFDDVEEDDLERYVEEMREDSVKASANRSPRGDDGQSLVISFLNVMLVVKRSEIDSPIRRTFLSQVSSISRTYYLCCVYLYCAFHFGNIDSHEDQRFVQVVLDFLTTLNV